MKSVKWIIGLVVLVSVVAIPMFVHAGRYQGDITNEEETYLRGKGVDTPDYSITFIDWYNTHAFTIITDIPSQYNIVLKSWYFTEAQTKFEFDHEMGHIMLAHYGKPQSEEMAHYFAYCYGSYDAKQFAIKYRNVSETNAISICKEWQNIVNQ